MIIYIFGLAMFCVGLGLILSWIFSKSQDIISDVDLVRRVARNQGLVLHMPSYYNGVEAYCEPRWQFDNLDWANYTNDFEHLNRLLTRV